MVGNMPILQMKKLRLNDELRFKQLPGLPKWLSGKESTCQSKETQES